MKIAFLGYGKMNRLISSLAKEKGDSGIAIFSRNFHEGNLEEADVAIDFSAAGCVYKHIELCSQANIPIVIGTTGWEGDLLKAQALAKNMNMGVLFSPNFSLGIYLFFELLKKAASLFKDVKEYDAVGIEMHHCEKKDAPSGTAKEMQRFFDNTLPFQSVRVGHHPGKHEIIFDSLSDSIHLIHESKNKEGFAEGALTCAHWLIGKKGWFTIEDVYGPLYCPYHTL